MLRLALQPLLIQAVWYLILYALGYTEVRSYEQSRCLLPFCQLLVCAYSSATRMR
jgi:hypothetical protein